MAASRSAWFSFDPRLGFGDRHPDRAAVGRAALAAARTSGPGRAYLIGDTVADMTSARANAAIGIGVCTGSATGPQLAEAGASYVLADVAEVAGLLGVAATRWIPKAVPGLTGAADHWFDYR